MWGEAIFPKTHSSPIQDYPHQCGEKSGAYRYEDDVKGLPPPVWGEVMNTDDKITQFRITPTSVGRSYLLRSKASMGQDYPHQCGEK